MPWPLRHLDDPPGQLVHGHTGERCSELAKGRSASIQALIAGGARRERMQAPRERPRHLHLAAPSAGASPSLSRPASATLVRCTCHHRPGPPASAPHSPTATAPLRLEPPASLRRQQRAAWAAAGTCTCPRVRARLLGAAAARRRCPAPPACAAAAADAWPLVQHLACFNCCTYVNRALASRQVCMPLPGPWMAATCPAEHTAVACPLQRSGLLLVASTLTPSGGSATRQLSDCERWGAVAGVDGHVASCSGGSSVA